MLPTESLARSWWNNPKNTIECALYHQWEATILINKVEIGLNTIQLDDGASILENSGHIFHYFCGSINSFHSQMLVYGALHKLAFTLVNRILRVIPHSTKFNMVRTFAEKATDNRRAFYGIQIYSQFTTLRHICWSCGGFDCNLFRWMATWSRVWTHGLFFCSGEINGFAGIVSFVLDLFDTCEIVCTCTLKDPFDTRKSFCVLIITSWNKTWCLSRRHLK